MPLIYKKDFDFAFDTSSCDSCPGFCCCGESGKVWVNQPEITEICHYLNMNIIDFRDRYLYQVDKRFTLSEKFTKIGFACSFFDTEQKKCLIYDVRPNQCRTYPFWDDCTQALNECLGILDI